LKIVKKDKQGNEILICESIDTYHGNLFVSLLNANYATRMREETYKLVELDYRHKLTN